MLVPIQFVTIAGIEPTGSLLVTLMVPSRFVAYLEMALTKTDPVRKLTNIGVDIVSIDETVYSLHGMFLCLKKYKIRASAGVSHYRNDRKGNKNHWYIVANWRG